MFGCSDIHPRAKSAAMVGGGGVTCSEAAEPEPTMAALTARGTPGNASA